MKVIFGILISTIIPLWITAQAKDELHDGNSFKRIYVQTNPGLKYSFQRTKYTHNYSGNWDFDGDKKMDSLYFIGDRTLHWFHLQIILSSDKKIRDYDWIVSAFPMLDSFGQIGKYIKDPSTVINFVVYDFNHEGKMSMYFHLNTEVSPIPAVWKKKGASSSNLLIEYKNKDLVIRNFPMDILLK